MTKLITTKGVKERISLRLSRDFTEAFEEKCEEILRDAVQRAKSNDRKTVFAYDL